MQVHNMQQGTAEWFAVRRGIPTASMFKAVLAKGKGLTRASYMRFLAGEIITGEPGEVFRNEAMERGNTMEPQARQQYADITGYDPEQVGFITNGRKGGSPDSLIGENGLLEIKTNKPSVLGEYLDEGIFPSEYKAQCQGNLWIAEREWIDLYCYWPKFPVFIKRAHRDEEFIQRLSDEIDRFNDELDEMVRRWQTHGTARLPEV